MSTTKAPDLPYVELDFIGRSERCHVAGTAMLADVTSAWINDQEDAGTLAKAAGEALEKAAAELQKDQLEALLEPSTDLYSTIVKLAMAMRMGWVRLAGDGGWGPEMGMKLLGVALSDLILLREAEIQRRYKAREKPAV
jgi:hypothetical protein